MFRVQRRSIQSLTPAVACYCRRNHNHLGKGNDLYSSAKYDDAA
jgi:hypothetical protein